MIVLVSGDGQVAALRRLVLCQLGGGSLMVWGEVQYAGKTNLIVIRKSLNAPRYCNDIYRPVVVPFMRRSNRFVFQQDNARSHIVRLSMNFLQTNNVNTLPWPSRSPDLAPIEHASDMLNNSLQELENALIIEWSTIPQYKIHKIIRGMQSKFRATIIANGTWTRY
jgi:hypothetical protein